MVDVGRLEIAGISPTGAADERLIFDPTNRTGSTNREEKEAHRKPWRPNSSLNGVKNHTESQL